MKNTLTVVALMLLLNACGSGGDDDKKPAPKPAKAEIVKDGIQEVETIDEKKYTCRLDSELIKGGGPDFNKGVFPDYKESDTNKWTMILPKKAVGDVVIQDCLIDTKKATSCLQVNPYEAGAGIYQKITTTKDRIYRVEATLIGAENYSDRNNFNLGESYVSVELATPEVLSKPIALTKEVKGNTPTKVSFDFKAKGKEHFVTLRGRTPYMYPTALKISVKELIKKENGTDSNDTVPCNL